MVTPQPHQRVAAAAAVSFKHDHQKTRLDRLYQQGSAKIRFPRHHDGSLEAVLVNTAGGLTGGDRLSWDIELDQYCDVVVTTQACEKSYKSVSGSALVQTKLSLKRNSTLHWLPQETILYDGSNLTRELSVEMEPGAHFVGLECIMLGREAMGETIGQIGFHDRWRIKYDGKLYFADDLRFNSVNGSLAGFAKNRALASLLYVGPQDAETLRTLVNRLILACPLASAGFSAFNGKIVGRLLAPDSYQLRHALRPVLKCLRGTDLPRVWRI